MQLQQLSIPDLVLLTPRSFADNRGMFFESFNQKIFDQLVGGNYQFVQDNQSSSKKNVLRGLHYQSDPHAQGKLVRVIKGEIFDVAVDLRRTSNTFGKWEGVVLTESNLNQLWIPEGFAHGFLVISEDAVVQYKTTDYYHPECERHIIWNDPTLGIHWPLEEPPILSDKDNLAHSFLEADTF